MKNRIKNILNELKEVINYLHSYFIKNHTSIIGWTIIILTLYVMYNIQTDNRITYILTYIFVVLILLITNTILDNKEKRKFPQIPKRFTKQLDDDIITIDKSDWPQAIRYLYEIEEYLGK